MFKLQVMTSVDGDGTEGNEFVTSLHTDYPNISVSDISKVPPSQTRKSPDTRVVNVIADNTTAANITADPKYLVWTTKEIS